MHDPDEIRRRIDRLLARLSRRDDYVIGGSLLDTGCPNEEEPRETPLSVVWSRSS